MLSHSRCLCRTLGRSLSALSQGNNVLAGRTTSGLSTGNRVVYRNTQLCEPPSSIVVFHIRYFKTSTAHRDEVVTVNTPPFSESITEGDVRWEKAVGDSVKEDEVVCEIETDKTSLQVRSPAAGVITELLVPDGGRVEAGNPLFKLKKGDLNVSSSLVSRSSQRRPSSRGPCSSSQRRPSSRGPCSSMSPSPNDGRRPCRLTPRGSTSQTFFCGQAQSAPDCTRLWSAPAPPAAAHGARTESRVKMNRIRLRIAQRLKEAQQTCAMLTTFNEIDMSNIQEMRKLHKDAFLKRHNIKLGFMSAFVKASAHALMDQASVNGVIDDTTKEIVYRDYVDISVAVATPKVEIRPMMYVALTYDHRLVDGREAVTFLRKIKSVVEDPRVLLLDM
ncbi:dihydrolipoyllysine-residue succinyltransferase component of 2-oxoglutarate dehydrogenase complex, mitochondrial-like [Oncorhynchus kisutch]|uniref:dihydrolipoyllysine-residue succinyltransferase component of 2-oxoglutarate dehydrogenase complex, mitochondrial-like n=1 Tax=Oncorhynchus kisutch TaxID=8019 RepID=UPI0012DC2585|nr:dihydrolipoyllysine-residue succinyltransferase component of 2-oxoglutarate dehydrogenase complex, mitochondrial-like [Oncorhynchus kisutch]